MFAGSFAPVGWAFCSGQLMAISENDTLFNLIGTTYGGDGQNTFALPDLRGRLPVHQGNGFVIGEAAGVESVTLTTSQIPLHTHQALCQVGATANQSVGTSAAPGNSQWAQQASTVIYSVPPVGSTPMKPAAIGIAGGSQPHDNMMPYLTISFIISLYGIYPQPN